MASPARSSDCTKFENRLAEAELALKEHKERLRELDRKADALDIDNRQLNLVLYNMPDTAEDETGEETVTSLLGECMPDDFLSGGLEMGAITTGYISPRPGEATSDTCTLQSMTSTLSSSMPNTTKKSI